MGFQLVTVRVGAENALRAAMGARGLRPAFARPGVVTFKADGDVALDAARPHPLARCWGRSLGRASSADEVRAALDALGTPVRLQAVPGEAGPAGHVPPSVLGAWEEGARSVGDALARDLGDRVSLDAPAAGDPVLEVHVRPDEPWLLAAHLHDRARGPLPGGRWPLVQPDDSPSRAWSKLEELMALAGRAPARGDKVLEIGCAPGGATLSLLDRGATVVGVDPQAMHLPARVRHAPFTHLRVPIEAVPRSHVPDDVAWLVLDASVAAPVALHALERLIPAWKRTLRGAFLTLKLNEWALADRLPELCGRLGAMGFSSVEAASLPSFRQEVGVWAVGPASQDGPRRR